MLYKRAGRNRQENYPENCRCVASTADTAGNEQLPQTGGWGTLRDRAGTRLVNSPGRLLSPGNLFPKGQ